MRTLRKMDRYDVAELLIAFVVGALILAVIVSCALASVGVIPFS